MGSRGDELTEADSAATAIAGRGLEGAVHVGEVLCEAARGVRLEVVGIGKVKGAAAGGTASPLGLAGGGGDGDHATGEKVEGEFAVDGGDVYLLHEPLRWIAGGEVGEQEVKLLALRNRPMAKWARSSGD